MSAASLAEALAALGISCDVEARDRLAVLRAPAVPADLHDLRDHVLRVLSTHGFTHAALELPDDDAAGHAPVHGA